MSEDTKTPKESPIEFMKRAVALRLKLSRIGTKRAVDVDKIDSGDAEKDLLRVTKEILDSEEMNKVRNHDMETRAAIRKRALPSLLGSGWYLIPVVAVDEVDAYIEGRKVERTDLLSSLIEALPTLKERSKERLGHLWVEEQFPTPEIVLDRSTVTTSYRTFDTPANLKGISKALLDRELEKAQKDAGTARDAAVALLRQEMAEAVDALASAFVPNANGRKPGLRTPTLNRVTEALDLFASRNIARDDELQKFVEQAKSLISGKDAKALRNDESIGAAFSTIKDSISALVVEGPSRMIDFEE